MRFDGPPRVIAAGFKVSNESLLGQGPADLLGNPAFDYTGQKAKEAAEYMRRHGPFEPHRLPMEDMEYTTRYHGKAGRQVQQTVIQEENLRIDKQILKTTEKLRVD